MEERWSALSVGRLSDLGYSDIQSAWRSEPAVSTMSEHHVCAMALVPGNHFFFRSGNSVVLPLLSGCLSKFFQVCIVPVSLAAPFASMI
jgi:hypothetical protein